MEKDSFTKKYNFRLPDRTIEQLDWLIETEGFKNRTQAIIVTVETYINFKNVMESGTDIIFDYSRVRDKQKDLDNKSLKKTDTEGK